jgi:hypothetical protein
LENVAVCAGPEVLMEVDNKSVLIVGEPQGILAQQSRHQLDEFVKYYYYINYLLNYFIKLMVVPSEGRKEVNSSGLNLVC